MITDVKTLSLNESNNKISLSTNWRLAPPVHYYIEKFKLDYIETNNIDTDKNRGEELSYVFRKDINEKEVEVLFSYPESETLLVRKKAPYK
ncbi:hypothetical protein JW796_02415 [Candidatus Dojkabacteria bacterium]|nr:hypothetical protein [Candidatus Dojkabacteria bacterium]